MRRFPSLQAFGGWTILIIPSVILTAVVILGAYFYVHSQAMMAEQLRKEIRVDAAIAALRFDAADIEKVHGSKDLNSPVYRSLVEGLRYIRESAPNVRFTYIMRKTADPMTLEFVADADALSSDAQLDTNGNGTVDEDEQPSFPGDTYDISETPALMSGAFLRPTVDADVTVDTWGRFVSGYAPIFDANGNAVAIVGLDMDAEEFFTLSRGIFSPIAYLLVILAGAGIALYVGNVFRVRRIEQLQQLDAERTALMDLASHQFGAPLATFKWWNEILRDQGDTEFLKSTGICDELQRGIDRMDSIVESLRSASRMNKGDFDYRAESVYIEKLIGIVVTETASALKARSQRLTLDIEPSLPAFTADATLLKGVVEELVDNASVYSPEGAEISLRVGSSHRGIQIEVSDHGYGIPPQDAPHIFEKFRRGSNATKYKPVGNGLGLSIAQSIIRRAKGKLWFDSRAEGGTTFFVWLPSEE